MSKTVNAAKKRDASLEKLQALMKSPTAPGQEQAQNAAAKAKPPEGEMTTGEEKAVPDMIPKPKEPAGKAQNMGLSLHPADQERLLTIEAAVRKAGIKGRPSTSLLIKLAVAAFDPSRIENLATLYEQLESQDGRRKKVQSGIL